MTRDANISASFRFGDYGKLQKNEKSDVKIHQLVISVKFRFKTVRNSGIQKYLVTSSKNCMLSYM